MGKKGKKNKGAHKAAAASGGGAAAQAPAAAGGGTYRRGTEVQVKAKASDRWQNGVVTGHNKGTPLVKLEGGEFAMTWHHIQLPPEASPETPPPTAAGGDSPPGTRSGSGGTGSMDQPAPADPPGPPPASSPRAQSPSPAPSAPAPAKDVDPAPVPGQGLTKDDVVRFLSVLTHDQRAQLVKEATQGQTSGTDMDSFVAVACVLNGAVCAAAVGSRLRANAEFAAASEALSHTANRMHTRLTLLHSEANTEFTTLEGQQRKQISEDQDAVRSAVWQSAIHAAQMAALSRAQGAGAQTTPAAAAAAAAPVQVPRLGHGSGSAPK
eukprot:TRINITY_DN6676_c1_g3_i2.p1 TRINITY_DN6676_c1_g3~~TRINITY_DN6676_c1_g3_i2.p1  ORF type:complete len:323 (+),score=70.76 TRINITY_DN6676_c1_g3_i2:89-1057(+)